MTRFQVRRAATAGIVLLTIVLGGCAVPPNERRRPAPPLSQQTLVEVEQVVKTIEVELASFVPDELTVAVEEKSRGSVMGCAPGGMSWGSSTIVRVAEQPDLRGVEVAVRSSWERAADFDIELTQGSTGDPRLVLRSAELGNYHFRQFDDKVQVLSFSTCFAYDAERDGRRWEIFAE